MTDPTTIARQLTEHDKAALYWVPFVPKAKRAPWPPPILRLAVRTELERQRNDQ